MNIRSAKNSDIDALIAIGNNEPYFQVADGASSFWTREDITAITESPNDVILVAEESGTVVGFTVALLNTATRKATIENIWVSKEYRKQKIGEQLLAACLEQLSDRNVQYIAAMVEPSNTASEGLFNSLGFVSGKHYIWMHKE